MGRILFLQNQTFAYPGIYYICGALKARGHEYRVLLAADRQAVSEHIRKERPHLVAFPCLTGIHKDVLASAREIKAQFPDLPVVLGNVHPTLFPEILQQPEVDYLCRGEGEFPTCELLEALERGEHPTDIPNISWKDSAGALHHNEMRPLVDPLDDLPFPDYSVYKDIPVVHNDTYPMVFMTRGCPFNCTYCHNSNQRKVYKGKGRYVRTFSVGRILDEVESARANYPHTTAVLLGADTLGSDVEWLTELLTSYRRRFPELPYTCLIRPEFISESMARLLGSTGCYMIAFGVESGSERVRKELLRRPYTNEQLVAAAQRLRENGIKFRTYNIIGFPGETGREMWETLAINQKIRPDFPWCSIFTPYPETKLAEIAQEQGYLSPNFTYDDVPASFFNDTILQNVDRNRILNLHAFFQTLVLYPWLTPLVRPLLLLPHNPVFRLWFKAVYAWICLKSENRSLFSFAKLALANRKLFK